MTTRGIHTMNRRELAKALGALGVGIVTFPMVRGARAESTISGLTWAGYDLPELMGGYIAAYGEPPQFSYIGSDDEAFQKVRAGFAPDFIHPGSYMIQQYVDADLVQPIDPGRVATWDDLAPGMKELAGAVVDGVPYFVPAEFGNSSVLYRTDMIDPAYIEDPSWAIMYDERYAGQLAWHDGAGATVEVAGLMMGFDNVFALDEAQLAEIRPLMEKQRDLTRFYWTDVTQLEQAVKTGEVVAAYAWNQSYTTLLNEGVPVGYMTPKEGILAWGSGFVIHKDATDLDQVYAYISAWTSPESGAWLIDNYGYGSANLKAYDLVSEARRAELGYTDPAAMIDNTIFIEALAPDTQSAYETLYNDVLAGA